MSQEIDKREEEAIALGAKHCILFGEKEEFRLYLTEINRFVLSGIWNDLVDDPIVATDNLLGSVCIQKVSNLDEYLNAKAGTAMSVALSVQKIVGLKKSKVKNL